VRAITAYSARRTTPEHIEDVVSETFLVAWRRIDDIDEETALLWLYGVARRVLGHEWRSTERRRRLATRLGTARSTTRPGPEDTALIDQEVGQVLEAAESLNPSDAEILRLAGWERLSHDEIATVLDLTTNAVSQRLHRARKNLLRRYEQMNHHLDPSPAAPEGGV